MSPLMGLNVLAVVAPRLVKPATIQPTASVDAVMVLGFVAAFCTIIILMYQHKLRSRIPFLVMCLMALSIYGFLAGTWALGFSLAALAASELRHWYQYNSRARTTLTKKDERPRFPHVPESRVERMFGSL